MRLVLSIICLLSMLGSVGAAERAALVIGNSAYETVGHLPNATNDARDIAAALRAQGFEVIELTDLPRAELTRAIHSFRVHADAAEIALVYYAGHGIEIGGQNYLIPTDAQLFDERDVPDQTVSLASVLLQISGARQLKMIVLDACRNNPFLSRMVTLGGTRATTSGLAPLATKSDNTLIAYAAAAGAVTPDGPPGTNSPYASAFLEALAGPPRDVSLLMRTVRDGMQRRTGPNAHPFVYSSLGSEEIILNPRGDSSASPPPASVPSVSSPVPTPSPADIREAQALLNRLGLKAGAENGVMVPSTEAALRHFQKENGLAVTGTTDGPTLSALRLAARYAAPDPAPAIAAVPTPTERSDAHTSSVRTFRDCAGCPEMVIIPEGSFEMGSPGREPGHGAEEAPVHRVNVESFALARTEVTVANWQACVDERGCQARKRPDYGGLIRRDDPMINISWNDAQEYIAWLNSKFVGDPYRLPSEAEWEFAARAGSRTAYAWGDEFASESANCAGCSEDPNARIIMRVGSFPANTWGLHDMHGNMLEWVADCWHHSYANAPLDGSAWLAADGGDCTHRVVRSGSWDPHPKNLRSAHRNMLEPKLRMHLVGFRPARALSPAIEVAIAPAPSASTGLENERARTFRDCSGCPEMVVIPAGGFGMGSPALEAGREENEGPVHRVAVQSFALARTEVTFDEWQACVEGGGCRSNQRPGDEDWGRGNRPVINVSWNDALEYIAWLNSRVDGDPYRLPSEAEWEYVARAGTRTAYPWGNRISSGRANCAGCGSDWGDGMTAPVGSFEANPWGLHDLHGNVWEWLADCWHDSYVNAPRDGSAWLKAAGGECRLRVLHGGGWFNAPKYLRSASRYWGELDHRGSGVGIRPARTL